LTQTIQPCSWAYLNKTEEKLNIDKSKAENNLSLLFSVFESLNNLCEALNRLDYLIQRKNIEQIINNQKEGEQNEN
jgi:hypothetical protein